MLLSLSSAHNCDDHRCLHIMFSLPSFFQAGTTKVIYAFHPDDPSLENSIPGHSLKNGGSRSILLLNSRENIPTLPSDTKTFEILHDKVIIRIFSCYLTLYNNQINARALIGQSAVGYCAGKPTKKSRVI